jgi:hypothetical protein
MQTQTHLQFYALHTNETNKVNYKSIVYIRGGQTVDRGRLFGPYQNLFATSVRSITFRLTAFFGSTYIWEEAFSQMKVIKSRYRSRLNDEHSK